MKVSWTNNAQIAAMFDGIDSGPCRVCGKLAVVPDDVMGVVRNHEGELGEPLIVCPECAPAMLAVLRRSAAQS